MLTAGLGASADSSAVGSGVAVGEQADLLWSTFKVAVQLAGSSEVGTFAVRLRPQLFASFGALPSELQLVLVFLSWGEGIAPVAKSDSPVRDSAGLVFIQNRIKSLDRTAELEGMQQGYRAIELALRRLVTRRGELNLSQSLAIQVLMFLRHSARGDDRQQDSRDDWLRAH